ncbi:MAG: hypothetical protein ABIA37_03180 [Candidatus Woesearchaeota archaeon]
MKILKELTAVASLLAVLGGSCTCEQRLEQPKQSLDSVVQEKTPSSEEIRKNITEKLENWSKDHNDGHLKLNSYLANLQQAKADLEKIGDDQTVDYVTVLTTVGSVYSDLAVKTIEASLPKITFGKEKITLERKDTPESSQDSKKYLRTAKEFYQQATRLIETHPDLNLDERQKITVCFGLAHACRVLQEYECAQEAFDECRRQIPAKSLYQNSINSEESFLKMDWENHKKYLKRD